MPPTEYGLYECHAFVDSVGHGEQISILQHVDPGLVALPDFYVLDGEHVLRHVYDATGHHRGGVIVSGVEAIAYRALAELLYDRGQDFAAWWSEHPEHHRALRAA